MMSPVRRGVLMFALGAVVATAAPAPSADARPGVPPQPAAWRTAAQAHDVAARRARLRRAAAGPAVRSWLTTPDQRSLLAPVTGLAFGPDDTSGAARVVVDDSSPGQVFHGAGGALTESSATVLEQLPQAGRDQLMRSLFDPASGIGLSLLRQPLGASDFALGDYTLDDAPPETTDPSLSLFSTGRDEGAVLPLLRQARSLQPALGVVLTPWSAPAWMKTSRSLHGGSLDPAWAGAYADYLSRAVAAYRHQGVPVTALTLANEPELDTPAYPSMTLSAAQEVDLAAHALPRALAAQAVTGLSVLGYDHNWDDVAYPTALLTDPAGRQAFTGVAFHCYAGDPSAQAVVAAAAPGKEVWLTECSGGSWSPSFAANLQWGARNLLIGNLRSAGASVLLWNLALDPHAGPTNGGCATCRGVVTVDPSTGAVRYEVEYYLLGQLTKAVQPGAVRVGSTSGGSVGVGSVAFRNPDGTHAVLLHNDTGTARRADVVWNGRAVPVTLPAGAVQTLLW